VEGKITCNIMSNTVAAIPETAAMGRDRDPPALSLYAPDGARKYLNRDERQRVLAAIEFLEPDQALFASTLAWTGARVSEVLALTPSSFQVERGVVALRTLKRRRHHIREVPIPPELMAALDRHFRILPKQRDPLVADHRLWPWHRATGWRLIKSVTRRAHIVGLPASPRGLRHGFGVGTLQSGVPLSLLQRWLGQRASARPRYTPMSADRTKSLLPNGFGYPVAHAALHRCVSLSALNAAGRLRQEALKERT
jgi:integrase/recombinase XerD